MWMDCPWRNCCWIFCYSERKLGNIKGKQLRTGGDLKMFTYEDFQVFQIPGLENRMEAIKKQIRPKFAVIGEHLAHFLTPLLGEPVILHIAKHARRTVHPPDETWLALSTSKRGYKSLPHFQLGLRENQLFLWFALIYEAPNKPAFARRLRENNEAFAQLPDTFFVSLDHTKPDAIAKREISEDKWDEILHRLEQVKKCEFLCGELFTPAEATKLNQEQLIQRAEQTFTRLLPLYQLAQTASTPLV
jgi:uncharacterized protein YktB (UPF0637 family)